MTPNSHTIPISGELTIYQAAHWRDTLLAEMATPQDIVLDLADVSEIDTAGVQILIAARRQVIAAGHRFALARCSDNVRQVLAFVRPAGLVPDDPATPVESQP